MKKEVTKSKAIKVYTLHTLECGMTNTHAVFSTIEKLHKYLKTLVVDEIFKIVKDEGYYSDDNGYEVMVFEDKIDNPEN